MSTSTRVPTWALLFAVLVLATIFSEVAATPKFDADGWHTWRVQSDDGAVRCCGIWTSGKLTSSGCDLDTGRHSRGCGEVIPTNEVQIYVRTKAGKIVDITALSPQCPVTSEHEIHDLGVVDNAESIAWLRPHLRTRTDIDDETISAIAAHAGPEAFAVLRDVIEDRKLDMDIREQALFWLVQAGSDERFAYVETLITRR
jgi:hypothetical protein